MAWAMAKACSLSLDLGPVARWILRLGRWSHEGRALRHPRERRLRGGECALKGWLKGYYSLACIILHLNNIGLTLVL